MSKTNSKQLPEETNLPLWKTLLEDLAGEQINVTPVVEESLNSAFNGTNLCLGFSQFNELLLSVGLDKLSATQFRFIFDGTGTSAAPTVCSLDQLQEGVLRFQKLTLYTYGNVKKAYKEFSRNEMVLNEWLDFLIPLKTTSFENRRNSFLGIQEIDSSNRPLLGYLSRDIAKTKISANPTGLSLN
jgi:hypothetical protein